MAKWKTVTLGEVCDFKKGETGIAKAIPGKYPLVVTAADRKTCSSYQFDAEAVCIPLVSSAGHGKKKLNHVHYQTGKFALGTILVAVIPKDGKILSTRFLHLYLSHLKDLVLVPLMRGAANVSLSVGAIKDVEIPLPSIEDQSEIVSRFENIDSEQQELIHEITAQQTLLKKLRQSILQDAIQGKLTADWRKAHPDTEPAADLLERIQAEKEEWLEIKAKEGYSEAKVIQRKLKKLEKNYPTPPEENIPKYWEWVPLIEAMCLIVDCHNKTAPYVNKGVKLVRTTNIRDGEMDTINVKYVTQATYDYWSRRCPPEPGDIFFTREAPVGEAAIVPENEKLCLGQRTMLLRPFHHLLDKQYALISMLTPGFLERLSSSQKGAMVKHLRVGDVEYAFIPLPPLAEQEAIVAQVEKLFGMVDEMERQVARSHTDAAALMTSVLAAAFKSS